MPNRLSKYVKQLQTMPNEPRRTLLLFNKPDEQQQKRNVATVQV